MLKRMRGLEIVATATTATVLVALLAAWDSAGPAGRKYRENMKKFWYLTIAFLTIPAAMVAATGARILAPLDPRTVKSEKGLKSYLYRRSYQGRHFSGNSVRKTLSAVAA